VAHEVLFIKSTEVVNGFRRLDGCVGLLFGSHQLVGGEGGPDFREGLRILTSGTLQRPRRCVPRIPFSE
jgi:hypothetical protein